MQTAEDIWKDVQEGLDPYTVRAVSALPYESERPLDGASLAGIPQRFHRAILDADVLRRRSAHFGATGRKKVIRQILGRLASEGTPGWDPSQDPLFWCLRAWGDLGETAYPRFVVEPPIQHPAGSALQGRSAPSPFQYRAMAAWACRLYAPPGFLGAVLLQVCGGLRGKGQYRSSFPCPATCSWLRWASVALERNFSFPAEAMGTSAEHSDRWQDLGFRPDDARLLLSLHPSAIPPAYT